MLVNGLPEGRVNRDAFFVLTIENHGGFKHKVPARGYNLKSWLDFEKGLSITKKVTIKEVTLKEYQKLSPWTNA